MIEFRQYSSFDELKASGSPKKQDVALHEEYKIFVDMLQRSLEVNKSKKNTTEENKKRNA